MTTFIYANESRDEHAVLIFSTMPKMTHQVDHVFMGCFGNDVIFHLNFSQLDVKKKRKKTEKEE